MTETDRTNPLILTTAPGHFSNKVQSLAYGALAELEIPFERIDNKPAATMEECLEIEKILGVKVAKSLFLCNRQQTVFYLFITEGDKPFSTKNFGHALEISRVSFAPEEKLQDMMGVVFGATTIFCLLADREKKVRLIIDEDLLKHDYISFPDGTTTCYMKIPTKKTFDGISQLSEHQMTVIRI